MSAYLSCILSSITLPHPLFSPLLYCSLVHPDKLDLCNSCSPTSCSRVSLENQDIFRCDRFPFSLIVKKVRTSLFRSPLCFQSNSLPKQISTFFPPSHYICIFFLLLFTLDQLIMSEKEGHYPEVISWLLSG